MNSRFGNELLDEQKEVGSDHQISLEDEHEVLDIEEDVDAIDINAELEDWDSESEVYDDPYEKFHEKLANILKPYEIFTDAKDLAAEAFLNLMEVEGAIECFFGQAHDQDERIYFFVMMPDGLLHLDLPSKIKAHFPSLGVVEVDKQKLVGEHLSDRKESMELLSELPANIEESNPKDCKTIEEEEAEFNTSMKSLVVVSLRLDAICKDYLPKLKVYIENHLEIIDKYKRNAVWGTRELQRRFLNLGVDLKFQTGMLGDLVWEVIKERAIKRAVVAMAMGRMWMSLPNVLLKNILKFLVFDDLDLPQLPELISRQALPHPWGNVAGYHYHWGANNLSPMPYNWSFFPISDRAWALVDWDKFDKLDKDERYWNPSANLFLHLPLNQASIIAKFFNIIYPQSAKALTVEQLQQVEEEEKRKPFSSVPAGKKQIKHDEEEEKYNPQSEISVVRVDKRTLEDDRLFSLLKKNLEKRVQPKKKTIDNLKRIMNSISEDRSLNNDPAITHLIKSIEILTEQIEKYQQCADPLLNEFVENLMSYMKKCDEKFPAFSRKLCLFNRNTTKNMLHDLWVGYRNQLQECVGEFLAYYKGEKMGLIRFEDSEVKTNKTVSDLGSGI